MIKYEIMEPEGIVLVEPISHLTVDDFANLRSSVDAYLDDHPAVRALVIHSEEFPGWSSLGAFIAHMRFVRDHHRKIRRVAIVTDSAFGTIAQALAKHFVSAEVRHFPYSDFGDALRWAESE